METTGAFDGVQTQDLPVTSKTRYPLLHPATPSTIQAWKNHLNKSYLSKSNNQCLRTTDSYNNHSIYCLCFLWTNKQNIQVSVFLFISKISSFSAQLCYSFRLFVYWLLIINNSWSWTAEQQDHVQWAIQSMWIVIDTKKGFTSYEMFNNATCNIKHMTASVSYASSID